MTRLRRPVVLAAVLALAAGPAALAQSPAPDDAVRMSVAQRAVWFGPSSPLVLEVEVTAGDRPARGLRATVALFERVRSRSQLRQALQGTLPRTPVEAFTVQLEDLPARASQRVLVEQGFDAMRSFRFAADGVYPLTVTLRRASGPALDAVVTAAVLAKAPAETPLQIAPVLAVGHTPLLTPFGTPASGAGRRIAEMRAAVESLQTAAPGTVALAVSPLTLDELRAMHGTGLADAAAGLEAAIRGAAARGELLVAPAVPVEAQHARAVLGPGSFAGSLAEGRASLRRATGAEPSTTLLPPGLTIDADAIDAAAGVGVTSALVSGGALPPSTRGLTPAEPARVGGVLLLPVDGLLSSAAARARERRDVALIAADTAMLYFESPSRSRLAVVAAGASRAPLGDVVGALRGAPWAKLVSPSQAAQTTWRRLRSVAAREDARVPRSFTRALSEARTAVGGITAYTLDGNSAVARLRTALRTAEGTAAWSSDWEAGVEWCEGITAAAGAERALVTASSASVTFTARRGRVPVTVVNRATYPVQVRVEIRSSKLDFPDGSSRLLSPLAPPGAVLTFDALTDATGTFPITVRVTSPDGGVLVHESELLVRSTAFNVVALAMTAGAGLFLAAWTAQRFIARRRAPARRPEPAPRVPAHRG